MSLTIRLPLIKNATTMISADQAKKYIGLMSGTSLDAIDAALLTFDPLRLIATSSEPIPFALKAKLLRLSTSHPDEIHTMGQTDVELGQLFAKAVTHLLQKNKLSSNAITAIGCHGQTIRHMPAADIPFTLQIGDPNTIAALTHITTVADFRRRDIALGGQGAPLAPLFHAYLLEEQKSIDKLASYWICNIGGIANITHISPQHHRPMAGFDSGPGNMLLDAWAIKHLNQHYDDQGSWASLGTVQIPLLKILLADPYFQQQAPKSTGREYFNLLWLERYLKQIDVLYHPVDIQATLLELTAQTMRSSLALSGPDPHIIALCGGGCHNKQLLERIRALCHPYPVTTTLELLAFPPDWIEAACFAWFAHNTLKGQPSNAPNVTGAKEPSILGALYPANTSGHDFNKIIKSEID